MVLHLLCLFPSTSTANFFFLLLLAFQAGGCKDRKNKRHYKIPPKGRKRGLLDAGHRQNEGACGGAWAVLGSRAFQAFITPRKMENCGLCGRHISGRSHCVLFWVLWPDFWSSELSTTASPFCDLVKNGHLHHSPSIFKTGPAQFVGRFVNTSGGLVIMKEETGPSSLDQLILKVSFVCVWVLNSYGIFLIGLKGDSICMATDTDMVMAKIV